MSRTKGSRTWGAIRELPSGRFQASYVDPEGRTYISRNGNPRPVQHKAPVTYDTKLDAEAWLADERRLVSMGRWTHPAARDAERRAQGVTFAQYAQRWLETRKLKNNGRPLAARTIDQYERLLARFINPTFGDMPLREITPERVANWYDLTAVNQPTLRASTYTLLRSIMETATSVNGPLRGEQNPVALRGAGTPPRVEREAMLEPADLAALADEMPEHYRMLVLVAGWCGLRFGELTALQRRDVDVQKGVLKVRRSVVRVKGEVIQKEGTKTGTSRTVTVPSHVLPGLEEHLHKHAQPGATGLVFPSRAGTHLAPSALYRVFYPAREAIGRPDLRFHDLRAVAGTLASRSGATLAEVQRRLGHTTVSAAMRYQRATDTRDAEIADALAEMAGRSG